MDSDNSASCGGEKPHLNSCGLDGATIGHYVISSGLNSDNQQHTPGRQDIGSVCLDKREKGSKHWKEAVHIAAPVEE